MKQSIRREALMGIDEYQSDDTAILCAAQAAARAAVQHANDYYFVLMVQEQNERLSAERTTMLSGIEPFTGMSYTASEYGSIIDFFDDLSPEELEQARKHLDTLIMKEDAKARASRSTYGIVDVNYDDASALAAIGDDNLSSMIEYDLLTPPWR